MRWEGTDGWWFRRVLMMMMVMMEGRGRGGRGLRLRGRMDVQ